MNLAPLTFPFIPPPLPLPPVPLPPVPPLPLPPLPLPLPLVPPPKCFEVTPFSPFLPTYMLTSPTVAVISFSHLFLELSVPFEMNFLSTPLLSLSFSPVL